MKCGLIRVRQVSPPKDTLSFVQNSWKKEFKGCLELARYILDVLGLEEDITHRFSQWDPNNTEKYEGTRNSGMKLRS